MMKVIVFVFCLFIAASVSIASSLSNLLVLYSNGDYNILVKDLSSGNTVKSFTVHVQKPKFIVMDYKNDILFFTAAETVFRIYLVDESGDRKISGKGELFTNPLVHHIETTFYSATRGIKGFVFDKGEGSLYLFLKHDYWNGDAYQKLNSTNGRSLGSGMTPFRFSRYILHNMTLYARYNNNDGDVLFNITLTRRLDNLEEWYRGAWSRSNLTQFIIDPMTNLLFYIENKYSIRLLNGDLMRMPIRLMEDRFVISDSEVTRGMQSLAVHGDIIVWNSSSWGKLYIGLLNDKMNFLSKQKIRVLDTNHSCIENIIIFEHGGRDTVKDRAFVHN